MTHDVVDGRDWKLNSNTISLDEDTVLDVPGDLSSCSAYCATLGHKANHSSAPNARYDVSDHPLARLHQVRARTAGHCPVARNHG